MPILLSYPILSYYPIINLPIASNDKMTHCLTILGQTYSQADSTVAVQKMVASQAVCVCVPKTSIDHDFDSF